MARASAADRLTEHYAGAQDLPACTVLSGDEILLLTEAADAYPQAFDDPDCLKMVLDWSAV